MPTHSIYNSSLSSVSKSKQPVDSICSSKISNTAQAMDKGRVLTLSQVAQHRNKQDCWLVIKGRVINVTKFMEEHPGGEEVLLEHAGNDATEEYEAVGHGKAAEAFLLEYQVGCLQGYKFAKKEDTEVDGEAKKGDPNKKVERMKAVLIKEDPPPNYAAFLEFFIPLSIALSYFTYRCLI